MTAGGGRRPTEAQLRREAGMIAARKWRVEHRTVAVEGHMPFAGHRTVAQADTGERWCTECKQLRAEPCRYALCALAAVGWAP